MDLGVGMRASIAILNEPGCIMGVRVHPSSIYPWPLPKGRKRERERERETETERPGTRERAREKEKDKNWIRRRGKVSLRAPHLL